MMTEENKNEERRKRYMMISENNLEHFSVME